ncbi:MAG: hypothetical protein A2589_03645 [Candidatus Vogelbacteria bacterium RIFOXYD1_FULL_46_19]|uniref:4a-hydroxytetrahydrobiopterin dehydratase n=1 Tax=Candidatus Vogelbacteria bacterium RIFOXYD1_FULL_46_19 TaxID=1802439 RepID=A0A1G2QHS1_9BACT|nr:MAG: hypothetical protein A2589_03645 [Candidatus Vogelbacteria bacterium RIFOXYD1_FULL_46_19]
MNQLPLNQRVCTPCQIGTPPLPPAEVEAQLLQLEDWQHQEWLLLRKDYEFKDFAAVMTFASEVARLAEAENHHPNIFIHDYRKLQLTLQTHKIKGLSDNDFILAAKIDQLPKP